MLDAAAFELIGLTDYLNNPIFSQFDGTGYAVAVLDTGAWKNHEVFGEDLDDNGWGDRIVYQENFVNPLEDAHDDHFLGTGHGTNAAGTIAQMLPGVDLIILKVLDFNAFLPDWETAEAALEWVYDNRFLYNIVAVNMSFGDGGNYQSDQTDFPIHDVLGRLANENVAVIASAGNGFAQFNLDDPEDPQDPMPGIVYPAADAAVISVGATWDGDWSGEGLEFAGFFPAVDYTQGADRIAAFSARHETMLDVFAPGAGITVPYPGGIGDSYGEVFGTSVSAPFVSAAVVLAQQLNDEFQFKPGRLHKDDLVALFQDTGTLVNDGDDEDDNVINTGADYKRLNIYHMAFKLFRLDAPDLVAESDWGFWDEDNVTADILPRFSGTTIPGAWVWLGVRHETGDRMVVGGGPANSETGYYEVTVHPQFALAVGRYYVSIAIEYGSVPEESLPQFSPVIVVDVVTSDRLDPVGPTFSARLSKTFVVSGSNSGPSILDIAWGGPFERTLTKTGSGTLTVSAVSEPSIVTFNADAGTTEFTVDTGVPGIPGASTRAAGWTINADATVNFTTHQNLTALTIGEDGVVTVTTATPPDYNILYVNSLDVVEGGKLDMKNNAMVIDFDTTTDARDFEGDHLRDWLIEGRGGTGISNGGWNGSWGITSSTAQAWNSTFTNQRSLGYAVNADLPLGSYSTFLGQAVDSSAIIIRYTVTCDYNLDGKVDDDDVTIIGAHYAPSGSDPHWGHGDADYNGKVDDDDVTLLNVMYNKQLES